MARSDNDWRLLAKQNSSHGGTESGSDSGDSTGPGGKTQQKVVQLSPVTHSIELTKRNKGWKRVVSIGLCLLKWAVRLETV